MKYYDETLLEMIELYADEVGAIASEQELSDRFDEEQLQFIIDANGIKGEAFTDTVMISEAFNDWTDMLCKEGEIHPEQYDKYCYVGAFA